MIEVALTVYVKIFTSYQVRAFAAVSYKKLQKKPEWYVDWTQYLLCEHNTINSGVCSPVGYG